MTNAIPYMTSRGCRLGMLPKDFPLPSTMQRYFHVWRDCGLLHTIQLHLVAEAWELEGRAARLSSGVIDCQSPITTESGGVRNFDAGK